MRTDLRPVLVALATCLGVTTDARSQVNYAKLPQEEQDKLQKQYEPDLLDEKVVDYSTANKIIGELPNGWTSYLKVLEKFKGDDRASKKRRYNALDKLARFLILEPKPPMLPDKMPATIVAQSMAYISDRNGIGSSNNEIMQIRVLGILGPKAKEAVPLLTDRRDKSGDGTVSREAQAALDKIKQ